MVMCRHIKHSYKIYFIKCMPDEVKYYYIMPVSMSELNYTMPACSVVHVVLS